MTFNRQNSTPKPSTIQGGQAQRAIQKLQSTRGSVKVAVSGNSTIGPGQFLTAFQPNGPTRPVIDQKSILNTDVYSNLIIPGQTFQTLDGAFKELRGIKIDTILFSIELPKNIVKTPIPGLDVTFKEYINAGDYIINAKGVIIGETQPGSSNFANSSENGSQVLTQRDIGLNFPYQDLSILNQIVKSPISIDVESELLNTLEISTVVFENIKFDQDPGGQNYINFSASMISDTPIELV